MARLAPAPRVYTIGHSTRSAGEFRSLLADEGIAGLTDVRRYPGSRRHPHFSREQLRASLESVGITYRHEPALGGRRSPRSDSPNTAWRSAGFRGYADHMDSPAFRDALDRLVAQAARAKTAVMCAEAVPWRCHRQLIADALVVRGVEVIHLLDLGRERPHRLHPDVRVLEGGAMVYVRREGDQTTIF